MYSMVLMAAMLPSGDAAGFGKKSHGCNGGCSGTVVAGCTGHVAPAPVATGCCGGGHAKHHGGGCSGGGFLGLRHKSNNCCGGGGFLGHKHKSNGCSGGCSGYVPAGGCSGYVPAGSVTGDVVAPAVVTPAPVAMPPAGVVTPAPKK
jgi:hypothetical protein